MIAKFSQEKQFREYTVVEVSENKVQWKLWGNWKNSVYASTLPINAIKTTWKNGDAEINLGKKRDSLHFLLIFFHLLNAEDELKVLLSSYHFEMKGFSHVETARVATRDTY
jgi:hypothetical protein